MFAQHVILQGEGWRTVLSSLSWAAMLLHNDEPTPAELEELQTELPILLDEQKTGHWAACR